MDVRTMCLGLLIKQDATGYEIKKVIQDGHAGIFYDASYGTIYPALNRMTEEGLVTCEAQAQDKRPDKKVYKITSKGLDAFQLALLQPPTADKFRSDFLAAMYFCGEIPSERLSQLLDEREAYHQQRLDALDSLEAESGDSADEFLLRYARMHHQSTYKFLRENRHLIEPLSAPDSEAAQ